ncbi:D-2-hydroxyacid dehydrogenase [Sphingomonas abaci]|uniref:Phosphoglycerate dehydrogenase-like enzyme n=1 Tax=Sphingomonas abaci TaxID=237611 RepID=A0A7W7AFP8_9SPHN|nr:D-2-hydroxyacid dehydrogenase [Sphingomonas abaci]MBB4616016.1 phosphoglycerate dehydrogenase-like enzyme [Sphingomonas abaci]
MTIAVLPAVTRGLLEHHLPAGIEARWFASPFEANAMIEDAEIAWVDMQPTSLVADAIRSAGSRLRWVSTIYAGLDAFPLDVLRQGNVTLTNGVGVNAIAVAEYAVMGILAAAKRFDDVLRARDRHEWPSDAPGKIELPGTSALIVGMGAIGALVAERLRAFGVSVTGVTRSGRDGTLTPDAWRPRLAEFDWVVLAAPSTGATRMMVGAGELAAMKRSAWLINVARGDMVDQEALLAGLDTGLIAGAFLDPTDPEPLPPEHPLWRARNAMITMHLSGRSQSRMLERGASLFLENLRAYLAGRPMRNVADLEAGY